MSIQQEVIAAGGSTRDKGQSWIISYWHVPGGYNYVAAEARTCFIDDKAVADSIAERYRGAPEMAFIISREDYEKARQQTQSRVVAI